MGCSLCIAVGLQGHTLMTCLSLWVWNINPSQFDFEVLGLIYTILPPHVVRFCHVQWLSSVIPIPWILLWLLFEVYCIYINLIINIFSIVALVCANTQHLGIVLKLKLCLS